MRHPFVAALLLAGCMQQITILGGDKDEDSDLPAPDTEPPPAPEETDDPGSAIDVDLPPMDTPADTPADTPSPPVDTALPVDTAPPAPPVDTAPPAPPVFTSAFSFSDNLQWPESGAWDPVRNVVFVSSLTYGNVLELPAGGGESVFYEDPSGSYRTFGVKLDAARRRLYACAATQASPQQFFLWRIDADTGVRLGSHPMSQSGPGAACRDMAVAPDGTVYITDRNNPWVHRFDPTTNQITRWADDPQLDAYHWAGDGVVFSPDGTKLLVFISKPAGLVTLPLNQPGALYTTTLHGSFGMGGGQGLDGALVYNGQVWIAATNRIARIEPRDAAWAEADVLSWDAPTGGINALVQVDTRMFALKGDPFAWTLGIAADLPFELYEVDPGLYP